MHETPIPINVQRNEINALLKSLRDCISDVGAEFIARVPFLERPFIGIGPACFSAVPIRFFYRRTMKSLCARWKREGRQYRTMQIGNCSFIFDVTDFTVCNWYFYRKLFEPETTHLILDTVRAGETVLDIGANRGYMSVLAGLRVGPTGRVFCFEPNPTIYSGLQEHLRLNALTGYVEASKLALSNCRSSDATFFVSTLETNSGLSSLTPVPELLENKSLTRQNTIVVETITLDEWLKQKSIVQPIDFVKIDVEGAEMLVLEGASETLSKCPPKRWIIETPPDGEVVEYLKTFGYTTKILDPAGSHANVLFTHKSYTT